jgi:hypothetical protein
MKISKKIVKSNESAPSIKNAETPAPSRMTADGFVKSTFVRARQNVLPALTPEERKDLGNSIKNYNYNPLFPIVINHGTEILDGKQRQDICDELGIVPTYVYVELSDGDATNLVLESQTRRNLSPKDWSRIAAECTDVLIQIQKETEKATNRKISNLKQFTEKTDNENSSDGTTDEGEKTDSENSSDGEPTGKAINIVAEKNHTTPYLLNAAIKDKEEFPPETHAIVTAIQEGDREKKKAAETALKEKKSAAHSAGESKSIKVKVKTEADEINALFVTPVKKHAHIIHKARTQYAELKAKLVPKLIPVATADSEGEEGERVQTMDDIETEIEILEKDLLEALLKMIELPVDVIE